MPNNKKGGRDGIRKAMDSAETVPPKPAEEPMKGEAPTLRTGGGTLEMRADGLFKVSEDGGPRKIAGAFEVLSQTRDDETSAWGLLLRFHDPDGVAQTVVITRDLFAGEGGELRNLLARRGLYVNPSPAQGIRGMLADYLSRVGTDRRARIVSRTGWHRIDGAPVFVLPGRVFGRSPVEVIYQPAMRDIALFNQCGTLTEWRSLAAAPCSGNSRLVLAVSAAFAGPLLDILGEEGGGLHFRGASRTGKTTALRVAASVWGGEAGSGAAGYIRQWRATGNAVEGIAAAQSDTLLPLDELGQADPREVGDTCYLLASGLGKARSDRAGGLRAAARFRVLFLSTGELSLADKIAEAGRHVKAGQEVRLVDIPADAGAGLGMFEDLHGAAEPEPFIQALRSGTGRAYGTAAPAFLDYLVCLVAAEPDLGERLRDWVRSLVAEWMEAAPNASGQVRSVARRFALVAVAGEMATEAGITGWDPTEAADAARVCFFAWLSERGTPGAREDAQAVAQLRDFLTRHGDARFQDWKEVTEACVNCGEAVSVSARTCSRCGHPRSDTTGQGELDIPPPQSERFRTGNRAGWKRRLIESATPQAWHYYLTADGMREALAGLDQRQARKVLLARGFLAPGPDGKSAGSFTPPGHHKARLYHILPTIFGADDGDP